MRFRRFSRMAPSLGVLALAALGAACEEDPTEAGSGDPATIVVSRSVTNQLVPVPFTLTAQVLDRRFTRLPTAIDAASAKPAVVRVDSTNFFLELRETRVFLTPLAADTSTIITFSASGLSATTKVVSVKQ